MDKEPDFVNDLFVRTIEKAPLIELSAKFRERPELEQIAYLHKLASSYHHAANELNKENGSLHKLLFSKEEQINQLKDTLGKDRSMIQQQLVIENQQRQALLEENQGLQCRITELEQELKSLKKAISPAA